MRPVSMREHRISRRLRLTLPSHETPRARLMGRGMDDTSEFPVQAPFIAGIRHNRSPIIPPEPARASWRMRPRPSVDEVTREMPARERNDGMLRGVEMMEILLVQSWLSGKMGSFFPGMCEAELLGLRGRLEAAARDAKFVADGRSPKQEFFAKLPAELLGPARRMYRAVTDSLQML